MECGKKRVKKTDGAIRAIFFLPDTGYAPPLLIQYVSV
jgi:hypothetical protein